MKRKGRAVQYPPGVGGVMGKFYNDLLDNGHVDSKLLGQVLGSCPTLADKVNFLNALLLQPPTDQAGMDRGIQFGVAMDGHHRTGEKQARSHASSLWGTCGWRGRSRHPLAGESRQVGSGGSNARSASRTPKRRPRRLAS